jgi:hypothetical protein
VERLGQECGPRAARSFRDTFGNTGLLVATKRQHGALAQALLRAPWGFDPEEANRYGETALITAARYGTPYHDLVDSLLAAGARINTQDTFFGCCAAPAVFRCTPPTSTGGFGFSLKLLVDVPVLRLEQRRIVLQLAEEVLKRRHGPQSENNFLDLRKS